MKRAARHALAAVAVAVLLAGGVGGALFWRLKQGPLAFPVLAGLAAEKLSDQIRGFQVHIDDIALTLSNDLIDGRELLEIHLLGVAVSGPDGRTLATVPEAGLSLSAAALLRGEARPTRLELIRPRVAANRRPDGGFGFNIGAQDDAAPTPETEDAATPVAADLLGALTKPLDSGPLLGLLQSVAIRDGDLTVIDEGKGLRWRAEPATVILQRSAAGGIDGRLRLRLNLGEGAQVLPLEAGLRYDAVSGKADIAATFSDLPPSAAARLAADLAVLKVLETPLSGRIDAALNSDFRLTDATFAIKGGAGRVRLDGEAPPIELQEATASGRFDAGSRRVTVDKATLRLEGIEAEASGSVGIDLAGAAPQGRATFRFRDFAPKRLAAYASKLPDLAVAAGLTMPVSGTVTAELRGDNPSGAIDLAIGAGAARVDGVFTKPLSVRSGRIRATADHGAGSYRLDELDLEVDGARLALSGAARAEGGRLTTTVDAALTNVAAANLDRLWPIPVAAKPREWVVANLVGGHAPKITASATLWAPLTRLDDVTPEKITAQILLEDGTLHYFRPLPPATKVERMVADFDGKDFFIRTYGGEVAAPDVSEPVRAGEGVVRIFNVGSPREDLTVDIGLTGPLRSVLTIVDMPPLGYPSKLDIKPDKTAGHVDGRLKVSLPLLDSVKLDDVEVQVSAKATNAAIEKVVAGRDATDGDLLVDLDTHFMTVSGKARFDGVPITMKWREVFDPNVKGPGTLLEAQGRSDVKHLATFGPDMLTEYAKGPVDAKIRYASAENRQATLNVNLDLAQTDIKLAPLNWGKSPGTAGQTRFILHFKDGKPTRITDLRFDGGGLQATAAAQLAAGGAQLARIDAPRVKVGATDMAVSAARGKDGSYAVKVTGASYDLRGVLGDKSPPARKPGETAAPPKPPPPMTVELKVGRLLFGDDRGLANAEGMFKREDGDWDTLVLRGRSPPKGDFSFRLEPTRAGGGRLTIDADDAGAALKALDVTDRVRGGVLKVRGQSAARGLLSPTDGKIELNDYTLVDAPALARILNAMSVTGLVELLGGEGINFGSLTGDFHMHGDLLRLKNIRTSGGALGLTAEGDLDLGRDTARLNGTVVPIYSINRIVGQIPLLGDLLSGGPGQGIFAATWALDGPMADPSISVNPLALLTPGFLRNLFFGGGATEGAAPPSKENTK